MRMACEPAVANDPNSDFWGDGGQFTKRDRGWRQKEHLIS
jgi:hypothetical protein